MEAFFMIARYHFFLCLLIGILLGAHPADAQNIQTDSNSTTVGSPTFGFAITPGQLQTVMQMDTAVSTLACGGRIGGLMTCNSTGNGSSGGYAKAPGNPGSFTHNPFKQVSTTADVGWFSAFPQTAPNFSGPNTLTGTITVNIDLGLGTLSGDPFHSAGRLRFTLNPASMQASIDQLVEQEINAADGLSIRFIENDVTPSLFTAKQSPLVTTDDSPFGPVGPGNGFPGPAPFTAVNLTATLQLDQNGAPFPASSFHAEETTRFPYNAMWFAPPLGCGGLPPCTGAGLNRPSQFPPDEAFFTPGLNTGGSNPNMFPNIQ